MRASFHADPTIGVRRLCTLRAIPKLRRFGPITVGRARSSGSSMRGDSVDPQESVEWHRRDGLPFLLAVFLNQGRHGFSEVKRDSVKVPVSNHF